MECRPQSRVIKKRKERNGGEVISAGPKEKSKDLMRDGKKYNTAKAKALPEFAGSGSLVVEARRR